MDTNLSVGACLGTGTSSAVIGSCLQRRHQPLMAPALRAEYEDVLSREPLFRGCRLTKAEREELMDIFLACRRWTRIDFGWRPNLRDEGDNHLIELAVADGATHVVARNLRDLRGAELLFPQIAAVTPAQFLKLEAMPRAP